MELYIRIVDGNPVDHPIFGDNFKEAFPDIDTDNLPAEFARFERVPMPSLVYATLNNPDPTYEWDGEAVKDVWDITAFTEEQITEKQEQVKTQWAKIKSSSWVFNEEKCEFEPPTPYPSDGNFYVWDEETVSWIKV